MSSKFSVCVIGVYFGQLPKYFNLWLNSCKNNADIDFLIIGDNEFDNLPDNVKFVKMSIDEMRERADIELGFKTVLDRPYKCCDFKVIYGVIFRDLIKDYDFWGHCDFDLIFGNIRKFITDDILSKYDKILDLGHFSLYRNTEENNNRYKMPGSKCADYIETYTTERITTFDELNGIYQIYKANKFPMYDKMVYADIASVYKRFALAKKEKNYKYQAFYVENGSVYRAYYLKGNVHTEEFSYIHFKKRGFQNTLKSSVEKYYITPKGFVEKKSTGNPTLDEINEVNPYVLKQEMSDKIKNVLNFASKKFKGLKRRIKKLFKMDKSK